MSEPESAAPVLDPSVLRELLRLGAEIGEDVLGDVVKAFGVSGPALADELLRTARAGDRAASARAAHTLRSAALQLGAVRLVERAQRAEREAKAGAGPLEPLALACAEALDEVERALARLAEPKP